MTRPSYRFDPADPRAPSQDAWDAMTQAERDEVEENLPSEIPRAFVPEGDPHSIPKRRAFEALEAWFRRRRRDVYLASELPIYYPDEPMFAPDLIAVLDVDPRPREKWLVSAEGRGLDFVLEIYVSGDRQKDHERNVVRCARLGIPEYFVFAPKRQRLLGYALSSERTYQPIVPQGGMWTSNVLGLELSIEHDHLRFYADTAPLPDARELIERLSTMVDDAVARAEGEAARAEEEAKRAEGEAWQAQDASRRAARYAAKLRELGIDPDALDE